MSLCWYSVQPAKTSRNRGNKNTGAPPSRCSGDRVQRYVPCKRAWRSQSPGAPATSRWRGNRNIIPTYLSLSIRDYSSSVLNKKPGLGNLYCQDPELSSGTSAGDVCNYDIQKIILSQLIKFLVCIYLSEIQCKGGFGWSVFQFILMVSTSTVALKMRVGKDFIG